MENYELTTQAVHMDDGALSGPVVNSPRQLWSVAGYLQMVMEGVFGLQADGTVAPKIPAALVPLLFGERDRITLELPDRRIVLIRPSAIESDLLVAGKVEREGTRETVRLVPQRGAARPKASLLDAAAFAPASPPVPEPVQDKSGWRVEVPAHQRLYVDGVLRADASPQVRTQRLLKQGTQQCMSLTRVESGIESLHSPTRCVADDTRIEGSWPRTWRAPGAGRYAFSVEFTNTHGPINTGITAAVKTLVAQCDGTGEQRGTLVMPHGAAMQRSSSVVIDVREATTCRFTLRDGVNMSYLTHNARYTGGAGGIDGPLNDATIGALHAVPLHAAQQEKPAR
jgi:hypothetical protein